MTKLEKITIASLTIALVVSGYVLWVRNTNQGADIIDPATSQRTEEN